MSEVVVKPVQTSREKKLFLNLPWTLYRGDPNWVPPLRAHQEEMVGYKHHPFYDDAESQTFLAWKDGQPCGRIAAILNHAHNRVHKEQRGFFGFFESIDDRWVASGLFAAVRGWFAERNITALRGPTNPAIHYECGTLIEGFDSPPSFMTTYNPPYYPRLIEECGFHKAQDLLAYVADASLPAQTKSKLANIAAEAAKRFNVKCRTLDRSRFMSDVHKFLQLYNESLTGTWGFIPLSPQEMAHMATDLKWLVVPELTAAAEVDGRLVACMFGMLDYNPRVKQIDGKLFPFGFMRLLWNRRQIKRIRVMATNVVADYQRWGLALVAGKALREAGRAWGLTEVEFSWILESNTLSRSTIERGGAKRTKTFRIYDNVPSGSVP